jgi:hypothetical protein
LLFAQWAGLTSLREIVARLGAQSRSFYLLNLRVPSRSRIADANAERLAARPSLTLSGWDCPNPIPQGPPPPMRNGCLASAINRQKKSDPRRKPSRGEKKPDDAIGAVRGVVGIEGGVVSG